MQQPFSPLGSQGIHAAGHGQTRAGDSGNGGLLLGGKGLHSFRRYDRGRGLICIRFLSGNQELDRQKHSGCQHQGNEDHQHHHKAHIGLLGLLLIRDGSVIVGVVILIADCGILLGIDRIKIKDPLWLFFLAVAIQLLGQVVQVKVLQLRRVYRGLLCTAIRPPSADWTAGGSILKGSAADFTGDPVHGIASLRDVFPSKKASLRYICSIIVKLYHFSFQKTSRKLLIFLLFYFMIWESRRRKKCLNPISCPPFWMALLWVRP